MVNSKVLIIIKTILLEATRNLYKKLVLRVLYLLIRIKIFVIIYWVTIQIKINGNISAEPKKILIITKDK